MAATIEASDQSKHPQWTPARKFRVMTHSRDLKGVVNIHLEPRDHGKRGVLIRKNIMMPVSEHKNIVSDKKILPIREAVAMVSEA